MFVELMFYHFYAKAKEKFLKCFAEKRQRVKVMFSPQTKHMIHSNISGQYKEKRKEKK